MYDEFPWIKFAILTVGFGVPIFIMAPTIKWKILFSLAVPVGVWLALKGKTIGKDHGFGGNR